MVIEIKSLFGGQIIRIDESSEDIDFLRLRIIELDNNKDAIKCSALIEVNKKELLLAIKAFS